MLESDKKMHFHGVFSNWWFHNGNCCSPLWRFTLTVRFAAMFFCFTNVLHVMATWIEQLLWHTPGLKVALNVTGLDKRNNTPYWWDVYMFIAIFADKKRGVHQRVCIYYSVNIVLGMTSADPNFGNRYLSHQRWNLEEFMIVK